MHLVMINGPAGVGKTETSRELVRRVPRSSLLWLDAIRNTIPVEEFRQNGVTNHMARMAQANIVAREVAEFQLQEGNIVVVDSVKSRSEWIEPWEELGRKVGATVLDVCLTAPKSIVEARASMRGYIQGGRLTPQKVSDYYDWITSLYENRPDAIIIDTEHLDVSETVDVLIANYIDNTYINSVDKS